MSASGGPTNVIGGFSIGLNPGLKVHEEGNAAYYGGGSAAGVVYVSIGDNQLLGGGNITSGNFGFGFPIRDRSEERRVGKECKARGAPDNETKKEIGR